MRGLAFGLLAAAALGDVCYHSSVDPGALIDNRSGHLVPPGHCRQLQGLVGRLVEVRLVRG
jgi:hypothetical protein